MLTSLTVLLFAASPLLIGPGLRSSSIGKGLDAINPFSGALNTFDAVLIDSEDFTGQLPRLVVVLAWLAFAFLVARRAARRPRFR